MKLYGITIEEGKPVVVSTEILKEASKTYRVSGLQGWLGCRSLLSKKADAGMIFFNPGDAIDAYISEQEHTINRLKHDVKYEEFYLEEARKLKREIE